MYINNFVFKRQGILFKPNEIDRDQIQRTPRDVCVNPLFFFHCTYPGCMPDMLLS